MLVLPSAFLLVLLATILHAASGHGYPTTSTSGAGLGARGGKLTPRSAHEDPPVPGKLEPSRMDSQQSIILTNIDNKYWTANASLSYEVPTMNDDDHGYNSAFKNWSFIVDTGSPYFTAFSDSLQNDPSVKPKLGARQDNLYPLGQVLDTGLPDDPGSATFDLTYSDGSGGGGFQKEIETYVLENHITAEMGLVTYLNSADSLLALDANVNGRLGLGTDKGNRFTAGKDVRTLKSFPSVWAETWKISNIFTLDLAHTNEGTSTLKFGECTCNASATTGSAIYNDGRKDDKEKGKYFLEIDGAESVLVDNGSLNLVVDKHDITNFTTSNPSVVKKGSSSNDFSILCDGDLPDFVVGTTLKSKDGTWTVPGRLLRGEPVKDDEKYCKSRVAASDQDSKYILGAPFFMAHRVCFDQKEQRVSWCKKSSSGVSPTKTIPLDKEKTSKASSTTTASSAATSPPSQEGVNVCRMCA